MSAENHPFQRLYIVGTSGSGKTTLAKKLSAHYGLLHRQIDELFWLPEWQMRSDEDFTHRVNEVTETDNWVLDGNFSQWQSLFLKRATTVIWLNYPFWRVFYRVVTRTIKRCWTKEELFGGNRETFRKGFCNRDSIILWMITTHRKNRRQYQQLFEELQNSEIQLIELRHPREAERLFQTIHKKTSV